jgi:hypothetical protein
MSLTKFALDLGDALSGLRGEEVVEIRLGGVARASGPISHFHSPLSV